MDGKDTVYLLYSRLESRNNNNNNNKRSSTICLVRYVKSRAETMNIRMRLKPEDGT